MRLTISSIVLIFIGIFYSCSEENKVEKLKDEVMAIHDEVMPEMGSLMKLKNQLNEKLVYFDSADKKFSEINKAIHDLEVADEEMMDWMRNYKDPQLDMEETEALNYLNSQKDSIIKVRKQIYEAKTTAKILLNNINNEI